MKDLYILRAYTDEGMRLMSKLSILLEKVGIKIDMVDHRKPDENQFGMFMSYDHVSLDRHLTKMFNIPYFQISRIFNRQGDVVGRKIGHHVDDPSKKYHIIDTDTVNGETLNIASAIFKPALITVPLVIKPEHELIDMEDLCVNNSLYEEDGIIKPCNYMITPSMFAKRTSLPIELYMHLYKLIPYYYSTEDYNRTW